MHVFFEHCYSCPKVRCLSWKGSFGWHWTSNQRDIDSMCASQCCTYSRLFSPKHTHVFPESFGVHLSSFVLCCHCPCRHLTVIVCASPSVTDMMWHYKYTKSILVLADRFQSKKQIVWLVSTWLCVQCIYKWEIFVGIHSICVCQVLIIT